MSRNAVLGLIIFSSVHSLGHLFIFFLLEFKMSVRQSLTSMWQGPTARILHLSTLHMHSLRFLKVDM